MHQRDTCLVGNFGCHVAGIGVMGVQYFRKMIVFGKPLNGVVGKFVEFFGPGLEQLSLPDQATLANMAPEYGATCGFFPIDAGTIKYLELTARSQETIQLVEAYAKAQGLWRDADTPDPQFTDTIELDMATVVPAIAGPKRPQDRIDLTDSC